MKIIVTGSNGFIGSNLVRELELRGHEVLKIDLPHDIRKITSPEKPEEYDVMIHLAGMSRHGDCVGKDYDCFDFNVMGTLNMIKLSKDLKIKQFIFASSEWVYGDSETEKNEGTFINTMSLTSEYALSKHVSEVNLLHRYVEGFCAVTVFRFGIVYGPRKKNWSVVESILDQVENKGEVRVGSLRTGRHFIHVDDVVSGIVKSLGLTGYHIINLQGDKFISLEDIVKESSRLLNKEVTVTETSPNSPSIRKMTNTKAKLMLGWSPAYDLTRGLESLLKGETK